ncbi:MAG: type II secretion system minor pseudopilin GspH [Stenotrophobium sp.]
MPRLRTSPRRASGFTLLEIMVVVLIIGILTTFATLSIGKREVDDRMEVEAQRLEQVLSLAADEAQTKGIEIGFRYTDQGYEFLATAKDGNWATYAESGPLRDRKLPYPFYLELHVESRNVAPVQTGGDKAVKVEPQIMLQSSGEVTAFSMDLKAYNYQPFYRIDADVLGKFTLTREGNS